MLFSFKEFEQTKQQIVREFEELPAWRVEQENEPTIIEYSKLLNGLKCVNKFKLESRTHNRLILKSAKGGASSRDNLKSATYRNTQENNHSEMKNLLKQRSRKFTHRRSSSSRLLKNGDESEAFYITELCSTKNNETNGDCDKKQSLRVGEDSAHDKNLKTEKEINTNSSENEEAWQEELLELKVKSFEFSKDFEYLHSEIEELERSIRYFQKKNNELKYQINLKEKKYLTAFHHALQKQSDLNIVDYNNKDFTERVESTERFFIKSLESIRFNRNSEVKKCNEVIEDIAEKMLVGQFYRRKIVDQKEQIKKLEEKNQYKKMRIQENKNMHIYAIIMLKMQSLSSFIREASYGDLEGLSNVIKSIENVKDKSFTEETIESTNFVKLAKDVLKLFYKISKDEEKLKQIYEYRINDLELNRKNLKECLSSNQESENRSINEADNQEKVESVTRKGKKFELSQFNKEFHTEMEKAASQKSTNTHNENGKDLTKAQNSLFLKERNLNVLLNVEEEEKIKTCELKLSQGIIMFDKRAKFFVKKHLKFLQAIIEKWLKFDQSSINFLMESINLFVKSEAIPKEHISKELSLCMLSQFFENWKSYVFFIEELFRNPILNESLTKNELKNYFKRIIKTKQNYPNIETSVLFKKFLKKVYEEKVDEIKNRIRLMLGLGVELLSYSSKNHVMIVNLHDKSQMEGENGGNEEENQNSKVHENGMTLNKNVENILNRGNALKNNKKRNSKKGRENSFIYNFGSAKDQNNDQVESELESNTYNDSSIIESENSIARREAHLLAEEEKERELENKERKGLHIGTEDYSIVHIIQEYQNEISKIEKHLDMRNK